MPKSINNADLRDISTVSVNADLPKTEKIKEFIRQIGDPHHYKCGIFTVTARFAENGPTIEDCLQGIIT